MNLSAKYNEHFKQLQTFVKPIHESKEQRPQNSIEQRDEIRKHFNEYMTFSSTNFEDFSSENKAAIVSHIHSYRTKIFEIFARWEINFQFHFDIFLQIDDACFENITRANSIEHLNEIEDLNMAISADEFLRAKNI